MVSRCTGTLLTYALYQQAMTELGISHLQPYAWRITPEKDELAVIFIEGKVYEFLLVLSDGEWLLKEE